MWKKLQTVTPALQHAIDGVNGDNNQLDTLEKLKAFWLFAIREGWKDYSRREWTARRVKEVTWQSPLIGKITSLPLSDPIHDAYLDFCAWEYIGPSNDPKLSDEAYADKIWHDLEKKVRTIKIN